MRANSKCAHPPRPPLLRVDDTISKSAADCVSLTQPTGRRRRPAQPEEPLVRNTYEDPEYADAYARLEWGGTYYLVRRELPAILRRHVTGRRALDFGCGTGRSTRLLRSLGFDALGVDISPAMVDRARQIDPDGDYLLLSQGDLEQRRAAEFDLVLAAFPFDNTPSAEKPRTFRALARALAPTGRMINIVSTPELYTHEWVSFTTGDSRRGPRRSR